VHEGDVGGCEARTAGSSASVPQCCSAPWQAGGQAGRPTRNWSHSLRLNAHPHPHSKKPSKTISNPQKPSPSPPTLHHQTPALPADPDGLFSAGGPGSHGDHRRGGGGGGGNGLGGGAWGWDGGREPRGGSSLAGVWAGVGVGKEGVVNASEAVKL
jgi:hypothetical protein